MAVAAINAVMLVLGLGELDSINALHSALTGYSAFWQSSRENAQSANAALGLCSHLGTTYTYYLLGRILCSTCSRLVGVTTSKRTNMELAGADGSRTQRRRTHNFTTETHPGRWP